MTQTPDKKGKSKRAIPLRQAGETVTDPNARPSKLLFGEVVRLSQAQEQEQTLLLATKLDKSTDLTLPTPLPPHTVDTSPTPPTTQHKKAAKNKIFMPAAPTKDFQKVANSIAREAIPGGVFKGKSKLIYDALYSLSRGAIVPKRSARLPKRELMIRAGIGSERTLLKNLGHLKSVGLIAVKEYEGQHKGNEYEVFLPEEIGLDIGDSTLPTLPTPPTAGKPPQSPLNVGTVPPVESDVSDVGSGSVKSGDLLNPKTFFKDFNLSDDDFRAIARFINKLNEACRKLTGRNLAAADFEKLSGDFVELLRDETVLAAARTRSVSAFAAFMTENLRRRLYSKPRAATQIKSDENQHPAKHLNVGKFDETLAEPLGELREEILQSLRALASQNGVESLEIFRPQYTSEDWEWIIGEINKPE